MVNYLTGKKVMDYSLAKTIIYAKGLFGLFELLIGTILLFSGPKSLNNYTIWLIDFEPFEHNGVVDYTTQFIVDHILGSMHLLVTLYLLVHGLVFVMVVIALVHRKLWAFPAAGLVLLGFIIYQIYELAVAFSVLLLIFTILDLMIIVFLRYEYKRVIRELSKELK